MTTAPNDSESLLTSDELAKKLNVTRRMVQEQYRTGKIPGIKISYRVVRFRLSDVLNAIKGNQ